MRTNTRTFPAAEIVPASVLAPLDLELAFGRRASLEVDLGCGDGSFLVALAQQNPERNFVGVEQLVGRVRSASRKIGDRGLTNAKIVHSEILHAVQQFFAPGSVDVFHLLFPDPWPKRRHQVRRTFNAGFLLGVSRALDDGGALHVATDDTDYFEAMQLVIAPAKNFLRADQLRNLPMTTFEARFRERSLTIHRFVLRKT